MLYRNPFRLIFSLAICLFYWLICNVGTRAQDAPPPAATTPPDATEKPTLGGAQAPATAPAPDAKTDAKKEVSFVDTGTTFKLRVNLVQVRVIVRDAKDKPVAGLERGDFQLLDQGKVQTITNFAVETTESRRAKADAAAQTQLSPSGEAKSVKIANPQRFVALVFDDIHLQITDAVDVRSAANRFLDDMAPTDRFAIYTTSGQITQEFTNDKALLKKAVVGITPRSLYGGSLINACPSISHYMADQIENVHDSQALAVAAEETVQCQFNGDERKTAQATSIAEAAAMMALNQGDTENEFTYRRLESAIGRLSAMPGERVMILASPGFLMTTQFSNETGLIDRANRANIVINTLDARGLYTPDTLGDISRQSSDTFKTGGFKTLYRVSAQTEQEGVLRDFAYGTGGTFFHNSNDLEGGLKLAGTAPEVSYILGFSPQNQKMDGRYHTIKVTLVPKQKYSIQARRGYYAPKKVDDPNELARQEIAEAMYSQDEMHDLPLDLQTQYFKTETPGAHLSVVSRLEVKGMHFRKVDDRNVDNVTVATAIFDENGNYVTGGEKVVEMHLKDPTYDRLSHSGLIVKTSFDVKPGRYMVRQVVRDSEGAQMAARNGTVEIPY